MSIASPWRPLCMHRRACPRSKRRRGAREYPRCQKRYSLAGGSAQTINGDLDAVAGQRQRLVGKGCRRQPVQRLHERRVCRHMYSAASTFQRHLQICCKRVVSSCCKNQMASSVRMQDRACEPKHICVGDYPQLDAAVACKLSRGGSSASVKTAGAYSGVNLSTSPGNLGQIVRC